MDEKKKVFQSMDANQAAAHVAYAFTEVAGIYPITPSSPMPEHIDNWASEGRKNLFGSPVKVIEMQAEGGAAGAVHGSLQSGALTTTFTASQGLLLMIPNLYKIAGEMLPGVLHVAARSLATHALSIFGDHSDVMACRQTGVALFATSSVQEVMDLAAVAHLSAIETSVPFIHFFDGFRTSHEIQKVEVMDYEELGKLLDWKAVERFRARALNPNKPVTRGTNQNDDIYFQAAESQNPYWDAVPDVVAKYMKALSDYTGRVHAPFDYYGAPDATDIIIAMGSVNEAIREVIDWKIKNEGAKVGVIEVHLYRPFSIKYLKEALPSTTKRIAVLDRTKEPGSLGEPLYLDIVAALGTTKYKIIGGRYGLSSKDTTPAQIFAVYENLKASAKKQKERFTIGIEDDTTFLSLDAKKFESEEYIVGSPRVHELVFWGLGSDGTVGANKNTVKLIGDYTDNYAQAYFAYDSKKSGGVTRSNLRFGRDPIHSTYLIQKAELISVSLDTYVQKYNVLSQLKMGGTVLLNTERESKDLEAWLPNAFKKTLAEKKAKFYIINANAIATKIGLGKRTNTVLQSAFFKLSPGIMPYEEAVDLMKKFAYKSYIKKGQSVVDLNYAAIEHGASGLEEIKVKPEWELLRVKRVKPEEGASDFVTKLQQPVNALDGYNVPTSAFKGYEDGTMQNGLAATEKRYTGMVVPTWNPANCIQCNQCAFVCSHAVVRPFLLTDEELAKAPKSVKTIPAMGPALAGLHFTISVSIADCTGCGACANICPGKMDPKTKVAKKALTMVDLADGIKAKTDKAAEYVFNNVTYKDNLIDKFQTPKNSQFAQPLFEFSGACGGCGETPYLKLVSQLFGDHMVVANATGCSSIYSAAYASSPYTMNAKGQGPAWDNSLFEDNAEFGYGMRMADKVLRERIASCFAEALKDEAASPALKEQAQAWLANPEDFKTTEAVREAVIPMLEGNDAPYAKSILDVKDHISKRSQWIFGGDGWAYDIDFGGLDHVIANRENVNILILDTEVYSNTGGQASKSSPTGAIALFTAAGKTTKKKDIASIAITYGHVYVAGIAHGYSQAQMLRAIKEAESYDGPSLIIAYAPCINHGIRLASKGFIMDKAMDQAKLAVECGYWTCFRYDPRLADEGKNPFQLDSKAPDWSKYIDHLMTENRYLQLTKKNPEHAQELLEANLKAAQERYAAYVRLASIDYSKQD